ncbi:carboxypeptidase B [Venturia canescens]|uniref:carboxypeptidase B n=1 Tax=Venturia canescens TaxID=32260 RepID=UPI001C9C2720|nr:carboxypeptidase B [Venturia canescens]
MMRVSFILVAVLSARAFGDGEFLRPLHGMKGLSIRCDTEEKLALVHSYENHSDFDFLSATNVLGDEIKVLVAGNSFDEFKTVLDQHQISYSVFVENVTEEIHEEFSRNEIARHMALFTREHKSSRFFSYYPRFAEIERYLKDLAREYSSITTLEKIGSSYEGNAIWALKISSGGGGNKPAILIDAGIHAREWIAPTTALYAIHQLVLNKTNSALYEDIDWFIIPSLNPDGYEYCHTTYRMWRKTRSPNPGSSCWGTDANRNFGYKWMTTGASSNPCTEIYAGMKAFSENETISLREYVLANKKTIKAYLTLHSYGQYMLHPWGFTNELPENEPELRAVAYAAEKALSLVRGTRYTIGSSTNVLYAAAGGSDDWVMAVGGVPLSYTVELPRGGNLGFNPPQSSIEPVGMETFEAFKVFGKYVATKYGKQNL